jgi:hypothetical protein
MPFYPCLLYFVVAFELKYQSDSRGWEITLACVMGGVNNVFPPIFDVNLRYFASEFSVFTYLFWLC